MFEVKTFNDFVIYVSYRILNYLGDEYKDAIVEIKDVDKNNGVKLRGLIVRLPNINIAPTIYLEEFFEEFEKGKSLDDVMKDIAECRKVHAISTDFDVNDFIEFDSVKERIVPRLVNYHLNENMLMECPYKRIEDLAVTFHVLVCEDDSALMSVAVSRELAKSWNITAEQLFELALENMKRLMPSTFRGMSQVLSELLDLDEDAMLDMATASDLLFVASNTKMQFGATCILDKEFMTKIYKKLGAVYIIPCSVHEVIIVSVAMTPDVDTLMDMIRTVNDTEVTTRDILSYSCYKYDEQGFSAVYNNEKMTA